MIRPGGESRQHSGKRPQDSAHQAERSLNQRIKLFVSLVCVGEKSRQHLQQYLVPEIEQLTDPAGQRIGQQRLWLGHVERLTGERRKDRPGRLKGRVFLAQLPVLRPDTEEPPVVRPLPVSARALALLDDLLDRGPRGRQVGNGDELRPVEQTWCGLGSRRTDEQRSLTEPSRKAWPALRGFRDRDVRR